jgi:hypothetical protein
MFANSIDNSKSLIFIFLIICIYHKTFKTNKTFLQDCRKHANRLLPSGDTVVKPLFISLRVLHCFAGFVIQILNSK